MAKYRVHSTEIRIYNVVYEIEAPDEEGAKAALDLDRGTLDDDVGEILRESPTYQDTQKVEIENVEKLV